MQAIFWPDVKKGNSQNVLSQKCFDGVNSNVCIFRKPMGCIDHTQQQRPKCFSFIGFHMHWRVAFLVREGAGNMERCVQFNGKNNKIKIWLIPCPIWHFYIIDMSKMCFRTKKTIFELSDFFPIGIAQCAILPAHAGNMAHLGWRHLLRHNTQTNVQGTLLCLCYES